MIKTIAHNTKQRRPRFRKTSKAVFKTIRYRQTSQTQDVKSQSTKRSFRKIGQPKRDSALEQKTRIVSCTENSASSQNSFFIYNQRIKPSRAQKDISVTYSTSFWKIGVFFLVKSPNNLRTICTKIIKTIANNTKQRRPRFQKTSKAVSISIGYRQTSQTQDVKNQCIKRSLRKIAQPKRDSALEQKTRIVSCREISARSQNSFFTYIQRIKPSRAQKHISSRCRVQAGGGVEVPHVLR